MFPLLSSLDTPVHFLEFEDRGDDVLIGKHVYVQ